MTKTKEHFYLLDILKILVLLAISILHANEFVFWTDSFFHGKSAPVCYYSYYYARFFTLGGQILISLVYFLFGYSGKSKKKLAWIAGFALIGQFILSLVLMEAEWDIYAYIAVTNLLILIIPAFFRFNFYTLLSSFMMLWIPTSYFQSLFPSTPFWVIVTGKIEWYNSGSWPLLPWFFLGLMNYQLGLYVNLKRDSFRKFHKNEYGVWPLLILCSLPVLGHYYWVPIGPNYYNFTFNQLPWIYWGNMSVFILIMRCALLDSVQRRLGRSELAKKISGLYWIRHLGLTYLISIVYLGLGYHLREMFKNHPMIFDIFFIGIMPTSEMIARGIVKLQRHYFKKR